MKPDEVKIPPHIAAPAPTETGLVGSWQLRWLNSNGSPCFGMRNRDLVVVHAEYERRLSAGEVMLDPYIVKLKRSGAAEDAMRPNTYQFPPRRRDSHE